VLLHAVIAIKALVALHMLAATAAGNIQTEPHTEIV